MNRCSNCICRKDEDLSCLDPVHSHLSDFKVDNSFCDTMIIIIRLAKQIDYLCKGSGLAVEQRIRHAMKGRKKR